jgi:hypothetical protein
MPSFGSWSALERDWFGLALAGLDHFCLVWFRLLIFS